MDATSHCQRSRRPLSSLLSWFSLFVSVQCSSMGIFLTAPRPGPQIIIQNSTTGDINHSLCSSYGQAIYPVDSPRKLPVQTAPKKGTSLAATGWWDGDNTKSVYASIWYQNNNNDLVNSVMQCNMTSGDYHFVSETALANFAGMPSVHPNTGLAVDLLGAADGYRLFFHDANKSVNYLTFNNDAGWSYGGKASPDQQVGGMALATTFFSKNNLTVVTPKDKLNIEVSQFNTDRTWHISTFPNPLYDSTYNSTSNTTSPYVQSGSSTELVAWDGNPTALGAAADKDLTRYVFYIGTDRALHMVTSSTSNGVPGPWIPKTDTKDKSIWPLADEPGADFAITYNPASYDIAILYMSGGQLTLVNQSSKFDGWAPATPIPAVNLTANATAPTPTPAPAASSGLTTGQYVGIGVGAGVGAILIAGLLFLFFMVRRRHRRERDAAHAAAAAGVSADLTHGHGGHPGQWQHSPSSYGYGDHPSANPELASIKPYNSVGPLSWDNDAKTAPGLAGMGAGAGHEIRPMSELPSQFQTSHELAGEARSASPTSPRVVYVPSEGQVIDNNLNPRYGSPEPAFAPAASPPPASSWSGGHVSPVPAYSAHDGATGSHHYSGTASPAPVEGHGGYYVHGNGEGQSPYGGQGGGHGSPRQEELFYHR